MSFRRQLKKSGRSKIVRSSNQQKALRRSSPSLSHWGRASLALSLWIRDWVRGCSGTPQTFAKQKLTAQVEALGGEYKGIFEDSGGVAVFQQPLSPAIQILSILLLAFLAAGCSGNDQSKSASSKKPAIDTSNGTAIELEPSPEGFPMGLGVTQGFALHLFDSPGANQGFKKQPPESGSKRHYDEFTLAGKIHLVITEESAPPKFYFDENRNGDLTDDRSPATGEDGASLIPNHYSIHVRYDDEKVIAPYRIWLFGSNMGGVRFYPKCHWHGTLTVNDKPYRIIAFDGNADGDYANDPIIVDVNGNDRADDDEKLTPGKTITIDGRDVTFLEVSPSGLTARFRI